MKTENGIAKTTIEAVRIIYNNDEAILDYLADLHDRKTILKGMDELTQKMREKSLPNFLLLFNAKTDNLVILIICKPSYVDMDEPNRYILYSHSSLRQLCIYFGQYINNIQTSDQRVLKELQDISRFLSYEWARSKEKQNPADFRG